MDKEIFIFPVKLTTSRIGNLTRLIHTLAIYVAIHTTNIYTILFELSRASISNPCSLVALELFFYDFSVPRPLPALILAARGSPRQ